MAMNEKLEALGLTFKWVYKSSPFLTISIILISVFGGLLAVIEPYLFKLIIDAVVGKTGVPTGVVVGIVGIMVLYGVSKFLQDVFWDLTNLIKRVHAYRIEKDVTHDLMAGVAKLDVYYFEDPNYYNTLSKASTNFWRISEVFWVTTFALSEIISVLVIIGTVLAFDWRIVALVLLGAVPSIFVTLRMSEVIWSAFSEASPIFRHAHYYRSLMTERVESIREIRLFGLQEHFLKKFRDLFHDFIRKQDRSAKSQLWWYLVIGVVESGTSVFAAWLVVNSYVAGKITVGELTMLWALLFQFASHVRWLVRLVGDLNTHATFLSSIVRVLHFEPLIKSPEHPSAFPKVLRKGIEFRNVSFHYPGSKKYVLRDVSFSILPKASVALVGENGSGKTTLIKLLCRLYDVTSGEILIDGVNIRDFSTKDLYNNLGVIFQDFMRYESLVRENIQYGRIKAGKGGVHAAALKAGAWEFIKSLDKEYETQLGRKLVDEGVELSGGQWQKVALARAFFRDAKILILDEPTAAVDPRAEYLLFRKFEHFTKDRITFLISHRFSTVRMAENIIVMDKGHVVEHGNHEGLMKKRGSMYSRLFKMQAEGYVR